MKTYCILKGTISISMACITNQIVYVCAFLTNFQQALVLFSKESSEEDVARYFEQLTINSDPETNSDDVDE